MIFDFNQSQQLPFPVHQIIFNGRVIGTAENRKFRNGMLFIDKTIEVCIVSLKEIVAKCDGKQICKIIPKFEATKKIAFIPVGYDYYSMIFDNQEIFVYEVGLGPNQHYYCLYCNGVTIAIINKLDRVNDYLDKYRCYLSDSSLFVPVCIFCLFLESGAYYNIDAIGNSDISEVLVTSQKQLIEKYDPSFIPRIISMEYKES